MGVTHAVIPEFHSLRNFLIQTKPYPIPKIAKEFSILFLIAFIIEPSYSSYNFPIIFVKKKPLPGSSNRELKFRMAVDYRLPNSIAETFKYVYLKVFRFYMKFFVKN